MTTQKEAEPKVFIERAERLTKEGIFAMNLNEQEYFIFCEGKKQGIKEGKAQALSEFKEKLKERLSKTDEFLNADGNPRYEDWIIEIIEKTAQEMTGK
jgi:hypothetical protein